MSLQTYSVLLPFLVLIGWGSLLVAFVYLILGIVGWRGPHRNRRFIRSALFALMLPISFALVQVLIHCMVLPTMARESQQARQQRIDEAAYVKRGDKAPSFRIQDVDGNEFSIDGLRGKVVLVNFFATWCGPCLLELPHIQEIWKWQRDRDGFALLVIGREETETAVREFRAAHDFSFPMAADPDRTVYGLFAKELIPRTYLISRDGTICFASTGFVEEDIAQLKQEIMTQLSPAK